MKLPTKLIIDKIESDHYYLGGGFIGTKEINPSGDWSHFLPADEYQNINNVETYDCTGFGTNNCIETLIKFLFYSDPNLSDRFTGIIAGTKSSGNSPHTVGEAIRNNGEIDEKELPFLNINSIDDFYSFKGADETRCRNLGKLWLKDYSFKHEWSFTGSPSIKEKNDLISQSLKRSPVGISVAAWGNPDKDGIYHQEWGDNHWVMCYGETETAWKVFDSYENDHKLYSKESNISMAKLYWIAKLTPNDKKSFLDYISWIWNVIFPKPAIITENINEISPVAPPLPIKKSDISVALFCVAIQAFEDYVLPGQKGRDGKVYPAGSRSYRNCNPGNLKAIGWKLQFGQDQNGFATFRNYKDGFDTLKNMIYNACQGNSKIYNPEMTIADFFQKYDSSHPVEYARFVANEMKCGTDLKLKELLVK